MYDDGYDDGDSCRACGRRDYGFEMNDVRTTLYISNCQCKTKCVCTDEMRAEFKLDAGDCACCNGDDCCCDAEETEIQVRINRIWDKRCESCEGVDWRPEWQVIKDGVVVATVPSEAAADAVIEAEYPNAEAPPRDEAWESEKWLRRAEGWG
jgi:hypothetical protein